MLSDYRIEVGYMNPKNDPSSKKLLKQVKDFDITIKDVEIVKAFMIQANLGTYQINKIANELFTDPIIQRNTINEPFTKNYDFLIEKNFRPGITDNEAKTAREQISLIIGRSMKEDETLQTGLVFIFRNSTEKLVEKAASFIGQDFPKFERVSFAKLMKDAFGISPEEDSESWIKKLKAKGHNIEGKDVSRTQIINIVGELLEEKIKGSGPVFVTDYFAEISPLARRNKKNPHLADRFELYVGGIEIANGYSEQNDPIEQKARFLDELAEKGAEKGRLDEDYIHALEHGMPPAGGLGIGIDRLVMLLTAQPSIREVILFPQMRGEK